jgi:hypothetical protein
VTSVIRAPSRPGSTPRHRPGHRPRRARRTPRAGWMQCVGRDPSTVNQRAGGYPDASSISRRNRTDHGGEIDPIRAGTNDPTKRRNLHESRAGKGRDQGLDTAGTGRQNRPERGAKTDRNGAPKRIRTGCRTDPSEAPKRTHRGAEADRNAVARGPEADGIRAPKSTPYLPGRTDPIRRSKPTRTERRFNSRRAARSIRAARQSDPMKPSEPGHSGREPIRAGRPVRPGSGAKTGSPRPRKKSEKAGENDPDKAPNQIARDGEINPHGSVEIDRQGSVKPTRARP